MVDIARPSQARKKRIKRILYVTAAVVVVGGISLGVSRLKPAAPTVDRAVVWIDSVKRGPMVRQVRGSGTLVPEDIRWIPAQTQGRVERIVLRPGAQVTPDTVVLELSNPELEQSVRAAQLDYQWRRRRTRTGRPSSKARSSARKRTSPTSRRSTNRRSSIFRRTRRCTRRS